MLSCPATYCKVKGQCPFHVPGHHRTDHRGPTHPGDVSGGAAECGRAKLEKSPAISAEPAGLGAGRSIEFFVR